jgi:8-oxo-dGTP pyrophosphatase MutT (NUDIX family)
LIADLGEIERRLGRGFSGPLPGARAQDLLAPRPRAGWRPGHVPTKCRAGAGLVFLYPGDGGRAHLILTVRDRHLVHHAGQVSLPGGALEPGESVIDAALREAREEVGVDPRRLRVLGRLTELHIPASGFVLHPVVAVAQERPNLQPQAGEVARILEVSLDGLQDPARLGVETRATAGGSVEVPFIRVAGEKVWGATAMVLAELLALVGYEVAVRK